MLSALHASRQPQRQPYVAGYSDLAFYTDAERHDVLAEFARQFRGPSSPVTPDPVRTLPAHAGVAGDSSTQMEH